MVKYRIAFICVHNSCRSQMAEAIAKHKYSDLFDFYSAGTTQVDAINPVAVEVIKQRYGIDMNENQRSKLVSNLPNINHVVTMGCNVHCPTIQCEQREDWGLEDPSGKNVQAYLETVFLIEEKLENLVSRLMI